MPGTGGNLVPSIGYVSTTGARPAGDDVAEVAMEMALEIAAAFARTTPPPTTAPRKSCNVTFAS
jgi:hypothetical protein